MMIRISGILPATQGSKTAYVVGKRAVVVDAGTPASRKAHQSWREAVRHEASLAVKATDEIPAGNWPTLEAVYVDITFYVPRPKSTPKKVTLPMKRPDIDKLIRSTLDGLTGPIFRDDSQVTDLAARKRFATNGEPVGASIQLYRYDDRHTWQPG